MSFAVDLGVYGIIATAVVAAGGLLLSGLRKQRALARLGHMPRLARMTASRSRIKRWLKSVLLVAAVTLCAAAVARPGRPGETTWQQRGIDLVVVMDFSASMLATDVYPSRLQRMTEEVEALLDRLGSDRAGVVVFAGAAAHFPLTHDHRAARSLFRGLSVRDLPPGSDLGAGIAAARCIIRPRLRDDPGCKRRGGRGRGGAPLHDPRDTSPQGLADRARAVVVFTDGEDTVGQARAEVERAALLGIEVYFVGIGTAQGELVPELDATGRAVGWKKTEDGESFVTTRLDLQGLKKLAARAGGEDRLFVADPERFVTRELKARLERLEEGVLKEHKATSHEDLYHWFAFPAFMLLVIEACTSARKRRAAHASAVSRGSGGRR